MRRRRVPHVLLTLGFSLVIQAHRAFLVDLFGWHVGSRYQKCAISSQVVRLWAALVIESMFIWLIPSWMVLFVFSCLQWLRLASLRLYFHLVPLLVVIF